MLLKFFLNSHIILRCNSISYRDIHKQVSAIFSPFYAVTSMEFRFLYHFVLEEFLLLSSVLTIHPVRKDLSFFFALRMSAVFSPAAFLLSWFCSRFFFSIFYGEATVTLTALILILLVRLRRRFRHYDLGAAADCFIRSCSAESGKSRKSVCKYFFERRHDPCTAGSF